MKRVLLLAGLVFAGCNNFDTAYGDCVERGACTDQPGSTGGGGGTNTGGGGANTGGGGGTGGGGAMTGGGSGPTGGGPTAYTVTPTALDFGTLALTETSAQPLPVRVTNDGGQAFTVTRDVTGTHRNDFLLAGCDGSTVQPMRDCLIDVRFAPRGTPGTRTATLEITVGSETTNVALSGEAVPPLTLSTNALDFRQVTTGNSTPLTLTITNTTSGPVVPTIGIQPAGPFTLDSTSCQMLFPNVPCPYLVTFSPTDAGVFSASVNTFVNVNSTNYSAPPVALTGIGVRPGALSFGMDPFNSVRVDAGTPLQRAFTLSSASSSAIDYTLSLSGSGAFSIVDAGCGTIPGNGMCSGVLRFQPTGDGTFNATLAADGGAAGFAFLNLAARGYEAGRLQWVDDGGTVWASTNQDVTRTFTLRNVSTGPSPAVSISLTDAGTYGFELEPDAGVGGCVSGVTALPPSASCTVKVTFKAGTDNTPSGLSTGILRATATGASPAAAVLRGTAAYTMMPTGLHFGFTSSATLVTGSPTRGCNSRGDGENELVLTSSFGTQLEFKRESTLDGARCPNGQFFWEIPAKESTNYKGGIRGCNMPTPVFPSGEGAGTAIGSSGNSFCLTQSAGEVWGGDAAGSPINICRAAYTRIGQLWICR